MPSVHLSQQGVLGHVQILATQNNCKGEGKSHGRSCWWLHRRCCARSWDGKRWQKFATLESGGDGKESVTTITTNYYVLLSRATCRWPFHFCLVIMSDCGSSEFSELEFILPSWSTRPAPPLPVGFGGVHDCTDSGAFIFTSSWLQGIAETQSTKLKLVWEH